MLGPIFSREFLTVPRRLGHYAARTAALGALWTLGITAWLATGGLGSEPTLGQTSRFGILAFQVFTFVALTLVTFFAALSAASTVAQEKDRRTFILLLLSDLRDYEIVLGKMLGSLLPILLVLIGVLPVLMLLLLLGGINPSQVIQAWLVLVATALAAGSLGGLVALWRDRTFQSLALSVLFIVLYFAVVQAIGLFSSDPGIRRYFDPFHALASVLDTETAAAGISPVFGFVGFMLALSGLINFWGIFKLRDWNPGGEPIQQREAPEDENVRDRTRAHAAPGAVREVWPNPVLWREIRTRAYGRRPLIVKLSYFVVLGLIIYGAMTLAFGASRVPFVAAYGLIPITILSLLLVAAQAVTAITTERDCGALDLLLVTDLSPMEFIFGKLGGILYNTKEFILPPLILAVFYAIYGLLATPPDSMPQLAPKMNLVALAATWGGIAILIAFVLILGIHVALRITNSRTAVTHTLGTVFFLSVGTIVCIYLILINGGTFEYQFLSFSLFLVVGIGGLWWVLSAEQPTQALTLASVLLPLFMFYAVTNLLVATPGSNESAPPLVPFLAIAIPFGFAIGAMLVPLLSEFDVALGRTRADD